MSISRLEGPVKVIKLPIADPPFLPSLNGSVHSLIFHDVNSSYEAIKAYSNLFDRKETDEVKKKFKRKKEKKKEITEPSTQITMNDKGYHSDENSARKEERNSVFIDPY